MVGKLESFEIIARKASLFSNSASHADGSRHPFETHNIHEKLPKKVRSLFDDGHFAQSTFEALKFLDKEIQRLSDSPKSGTDMMMSVFGGDVPKLPINDLSSQSLKDEQSGYKFLFAGTILGIRNPRGHEYEVNDAPDACLDHLALTSMLLRRMEAAGYKIGK